MLRDPLLTVLILLGALVSCSPGPPPDLPAFGERRPGWVDVRLALPSDRPATLGGDGDCELLHELGAVPLSGSQLDPDSTLQLLDGLLMLNDLQLEAPPYELRSLDGSPLRVGGKRYRGLVRIEVSPQGTLRVVNRLSIEDYLRGVLPGEMPDRFGLEALKAQAVAARSYALSEGAQRGWLHPDVRSQVYGGMGVETWLSGQAIATTAGQVLTHEGLVISAWFQSTCGGATARARDVFPNAAGGLLDEEVVCADCRHSPTWSWQRRVSAALVCAAAGLPEAPLQAVAVDLEAWPGRPSWIRVTAGGQEAQIRVHDFRDRVSKGQSWKEQVLSTRWSSAPSIEFSGTNGTHLLVNGHGWGHGVGLCQYGASGFARRGAGYRVLLTRYYPGAELVQLL